MSPGVAKCPLGAEPPRLRTPGLEFHFHEEEDSVTMLSSEQDIIDTSTCYTYTSKRLE